MEEWLAIGLSAAALAVSIYALRQTSEMKRRDRTIEARLVLDEARAVLRAQSLRPLKLKRSWHGYLASVGSFYSGHRLEVEAALHAAEETLAGLNAEADSRSVALTGGQADIDLELVAVKDLLLRAQAVAAELDESAANLEYARLSIPPTPPPPARSGG